MTPLQGVLRSTGTTPIPQAQQGILTSLVALERQRALTLPYVTQQHRGWYVCCLIVAAGYREVTLLGQNIDAYGRDLPGMAEDGSGRRQHTFTDLLRHVHDVPGIERIRFATSHPRYFTGRSCRGTLLTLMCGRHHLVMVQAGAQCAALCVVLKVNLVCY